MPWLQVILTTDRERAPLVEAALENVGALAITLVDAGDEPQLEPAPGATPLWSEVRVTALLPDKPGSHAHAQRLVAAISSQLAVSARFEILEDRPWERVWLDDLGPTRFGRHLWVCPRGQAAGAVDAVIVELDPGLAFGTGHHPTTALCLRWLDGAKVADATLVDYGCGSGILAIAALRLGAKRALAVDYDPQALEATRSNARDNGVSDQLLVCAPEDRPEITADLVLANILAGPLVELAPRLTALVGAGGQLVLSGLLQGQIAQVSAAYEDHFDLDPPQIEAEWVLLSGRRKSRA